MEQIATGSTEYLRVGPVTAEDTNGPVDVTALDVEIGFSLDTNEPADWLAADWETIRGEHWARVLVGPDGVTDFEPGTSVQVWLRVVDDPETVLQKVDDIRFY